MTEKTGKPLVIEVLSGLQASGKTTYALDKAAKPGWKRVNKDALRAMVDAGHHSKRNERQILAARDALVRLWLAEGYHVVVDDTNLAPAHIARMRQIAAEHTAASDREVTVEPCHFPIELEEAIRRDLARPDSVGERVIRRTHDRYLRHKATYAPDPALPAAVLVDLDGTLAKMGDRSPYDWARVGEDTLNEPVADVVRRMACDTTVVALSARDGVAREATEAWLAAHDVPYDELVMRAAGDTRRDATVKAEILDRDILPRYRVSLVLDDRDQVVRMWRDRGLTCWQVADGDF